MSDHAKHDELMASLKVLVTEACKTGSIESQLNADGVTVKLHFGKSKAGDLELARKVTALLAQETM